MQPRSTALSSLERVRSVALQRARQQLADCSAQLAAAEAALVAALTALEDHDAMPPSQARALVSGASLRRDGAAQRGQQQRRARLRAAIAQARRQVAEAEKRLGDARADVGRADAEHRVVRQRAEASARVEQRQRGAAVDDELDELAAARAHRPR